MWKNSLMLLMQMLLSKGLKEKSNKCLKIEAKTIKWMKNLQTSWTNKQKNTTSYWGPLHTENSEPGERMRSSAETSNTASSTVHGERVMQLQRSGDRGKCAAYRMSLLKVYGNINYTYQNSVSTGRMKLWTKNEKNYFLLSKPDFPLWENNLWKLNGSFPST